MSEKLDIIQVDNKDENLFVDNIRLDSDNLEFYKAVESIENGSKITFVTGKAGTGKTTFLKYLKSKYADDMVILAPTGVAAINAGGQTIHSFFKLPLSIFIPKDQRLSVYRDNPTNIWSTFNYTNSWQELVMAMKLLVIDEVSMVRCDIIDTIDRILRVYRRKLKKTFGGVQVLLIGDCYQLPPIATNEEWNILKEFYKDKYFFNSHVLMNNELLYIELKKIYRQQDQSFVNILNKVRSNTISEIELNTLNKRYDPLFNPKDETYITLSTHNALVDRINITRLHESDSPIFDFEAVIEGDFPDSLFPTDQILRIRIGAQVMFVKNDRGGRYYNGKIGRVINIIDNDIHIEFEDGSQIVAMRDSWDNIRYKWNSTERQIEQEILGNFIQYPIKLAWAITVHKSQGLTFDKVILDIAKSFAPGQVYVALSRCTSIDGIVLRTLIPRSAIMTDNTVIEFDKQQNKL